MSGRGCGARDIFPLSQKWTNRLEFAHNRQQARRANWLLRRPTKACLWFACGSGSV